MLDTVKLGIPLSKKQYDRIRDIAFVSPTPQWALLYPDTGELHLRRVQGLATTDQQSFHREIRWDVPFNYHTDETYLTVELSLPKLYYGHNIHLLYNYVEALELLKKLLEKRFSLKGRGQLSSIYSWQLWRVDCCYAWRTPSETSARQVLDSLTHLHFPRKKPHIYPGESVLFAGATYSLKFYLKLPEFKQHDKRELLKSKASLEWINHCEELATGVLRVEATLRRKYLERQGIQTVSDLLSPAVEYLFDPDSYPEDYDFNSAIMAIIDYTMLQHEEDEDWSYITEYAENGQRFNAPEGYEIEIRSRKGVIHYRHTGDGFILSKRDRPTAILQYLLTKFLGQNPGMQQADEVETKLNTVFKPVKAARLMSMWLYVQRFGTKKAKEAFGHNSYYVARRDMKKAGVSLIEPPKNVIVREANFWQKFKVEVPNEFVTNRVDDFRDGGNILNLPKVASDR